MPTNVEQRISSQIRRTVRDGVPVYEKQYVTNEWDDDASVIRRRARCEVEILRQIAASNRFGQRLGVVRIAHAEPDVAIIATHEVAGDSLGQFIHHGNIVSTGMKPWLLAGRWLRQFQSLPLNKYATETASKRDPPDIVDYCNLRLRSLSDYHYAWPNASVRKSLLQTIEHLRDQCSAADMPAVWVHADYAPGNLMWDGRVLTPIDFGMVRAGYPLEDATYLIHRIEMLRIYRPWSQIPIASIRRAVLRGLGVPTADQSAAYQMLMIKHHLCRLHTYVRRPPKNFKQSLHDRWVRAVLRKRLNAHRFVNCKTSTPSYSGETFL